MNGIPNSPASGYAPVKNVLFANNTFYDCSLPWNFCVGVSERNRIVAPQNTWVVNNVVYCPNENELIKSYDKTDGITFGNNLMITKKGNLKNNGTVDGTVLNSEKSGVNMIFTEVKPLENLIEKSKLQPSNKSAEYIGAFQNDKTNQNEDRMNSQNYGPKWFTPDISASNKAIKGKTLHVKPGTNNLSKAVSEAENGDILLLDSGMHIITQKISLNKSITLKSAHKSVLKMESGRAEESMFEIPSNVKIRMKGLKIEGNASTKNAFSTSEHALGYSLFLDNCDISGFYMKDGAVLNSLYCTMADSIVISNSVLHDSYSGLNLHKELEDGKYNAETVILYNSIFAKMTNFALDYYRGGYDESTVGGSLSINHCVFDSIGNDSSPAIMNLSRIMYVKINNSIFSNSQAKTSISLWYLYNKVSNSCFYNCPKPEFTKKAASKNLIFENPSFNTRTYSLSDVSSLRGKATDGKNIGLK
jgi:poly(beta-D-mannuronate) lyase